MSYHFSSNRFALLMIFAAFVSSMSYGQTHLTGSFTDSRDGKSYKTVSIGGRWWMAENLNYATETGSWSVENNSDGSQFGRFYNWETAKKVAPAGWHLPSKQEFQNLLDSIGGSDEELFHQLLNEGKSGFNAVLTGSHLEAYGRKGRYANFWSSTLWWFSSLFGITENPWRLCLGSGENESFAQIGHFAESDCGFNVRCVKDE